MGRIKKNTIDNIGSSHVYEIQGKGYLHGKFHEPLKTKHGGVRAHIDAGYTVYLNPKTNDKLKEANAYIAYQTTREVFERVQEYIPYDTGKLLHTIRRTEYKSGDKNKWAAAIEMTGPYVHYMYYGRVYGPNFAQLDSNGNLTGFKSPKHKYPTGRPIQYNTAHSPKAGPRWFDRLKADKKDEILLSVKRGLYAKMGVRCK